MTSLFYRRHSVVQKLVVVAATSRLCVVLGQDLGSMEFSPCVTLGTVGYRTGKRNRVS